MNRIALVGECLLDDSRKQCPKKCRFRAACFPSLPLDDLTIDPGSYVFG